MCAIPEIEGFYQVVKVLSLSIKLYCDIYFISIFKMIHINKIKFEFISNIYNYEYLGIMFQ